jgi:hypothetical protein
LRSPSALAFGTSARADDTFRAETDDWILTAPAALGTQADLELNARGVQLCHDEIEKVIGHRPHERRQVQDDVADRRRPHFLRHHHRQPVR